MEYLGRIFEEPLMDDDGKWNPVELVYEEDCDFYEATSKALRMFAHPNGDGKCIVADSLNNRYVLENIHINYDAYGNSIKLFPVSCRKLKN
jgi:hypothetical protein